MIRIPAFAAGLPVGKYGVIMFMSAAGAKSRVYLYKGVEPPAQDKGAGNG